MGHAESAVQMLVHDDVATGEGAAPAYPGSIRGQGQVLEADGVVAAWTGYARTGARRSRSRSRRGRGGEGGAALPAASTWKRLLNSAT